MNLQELIHLLRTETEDQIDARREEIAQLMPSVRIMFDFDQRNSAHQYDLWIHCIHTVTGLDHTISDDMLYLAALVHDIGKPDCQCRGKREDDPDMHYYGHPKRSMEIVRDRVIPELVDSGNPLTQDECRRLLYYVNEHDDHVSLSVDFLEKHLQKGASLREFQLLMKLQVADAIAHVQIPIVVRRVENCTLLSGEYAEELYRQLYEE